ncbi:MAG: magnesium/cobalt transporter CorA [Campylobacterota bacterium]
MVKFYLRDKKSYKSIDEIDTSKISDVIWIDMYSPSTKEISFVQETFDIKFPTKQESEEIEISSRYWETDKKIEINSYFLVTNEKLTKNETVSFILKNDLLFSVRYEHLETFDEIEKKYLVSTKIFKDGSDVLSNILDIRIDADADAIEELSKDISKLRKMVFTDHKNKEELILGKISSYEDLNMKIRENITDKQRILSALLKSINLKDELQDELQVMIKDVRSLVDYTQFNFERLEYLQNIFVGVLSIEQNKVIKMFSIVNVVFLPPTLIASIYGMNFEILPELQWDYGYPFAIILMVLSAVTPIYIFKKKGWV